MDCLSIDCLLLVLEKELTGVDDDNNSLFLGAIKYRDKIIHVG